MKFFGYFRGMPYEDSNDDFEDYGKIRNTLSREAIISHIESLEPALVCFVSCDIFTGEELTAGQYIDGEFRFPLEFLHYYKNYDIGIPPEYEEYLMKKGVR